MQKQIDNLLAHQLIAKEEVEEMKKILSGSMEQYQYNKKVMEMASQYTGVAAKESNQPIFDALGYLECTRHVGKDDPYPERTYLRQREKELNNGNQDSINADLIRYLNQLNAAGLLSPTDFADCEASINKGDQKDKFDLLSKLSVKSGLGQVVTDFFNLVKEKKSYLSADQIETAIKGWEECGILKHLTTEQAETAKKQALASDNTNLNDVIVQFPGVVHWFDTELENLNDPYAELVQTMSNISHKVFNPTNISDNFSHPVNGKVTMKFSLHNKSYSKTLQLQDDWVDTDFFVFVNQVVKENKLEGKFYQLNEGGQGGIIIFLTPGQYQCLKANKLLDFLEEE